VVRRAVLWAFVLLAGLLLACLSPTVRPTATATEPPTAIYTLTATQPTETLVSPTPTLTPTPTSEPEDTGWTPTESGPEVRSLNVALEEGKERVTVVRVRPDVVQLRVAYHPGKAQYLSAWADPLDPLVAVNGGYFTSDLVATGLVVSEGRVSGTSYGEFAGMLYAGVDGVPQLRWLQTTPYRSDEMLNAAVQCFPVLVKPGGVMGFPAGADDGRTARRTVVAQDGSGRMLFLVAARGFFDLHTLAMWLVESDLDIDIALNLDGGPSSGLWVPGAATIDSLLPVPVAVLVLPR